MIAGFHIKPTRTSKTTELKKKALSWVFKVLKTEVQNFLWGYCFTLLKPLRTDFTNLTQHDHRLDRATKKFRHSDFHSFDAASLHLLPLASAFCSKNTGGINNIGFTELFYGRIEESCITSTVVQRGRLCVTDLWLKPWAACFASRVALSTVWAPRSSEWVRGRQKGKEKGAISHFSSSFSPPIHFLNNPWT